MFRVISHRGDFLRVSRSGTMVSGPRDQSAPWFQAKALIVEPDPKVGRASGLYFGTVTPREVGGAVIRNRLRRRVRAILQNWARQQLSSPERATDQDLGAVVAKRFLVVFYFRKSERGFYERQGYDQLSERILRSLEFALQRAQRGHLRGRSR